MAYKKFNEMKQEVKDVFGENAVLIYKLPKNLSHNLHVIIKIKDEFIGEGHSYESALMRAMMHFTRIKHFSFKANILIGFFISGLICANLLGSKISSFAGIDFSVGVFIFPITFIVTDIISEVYGKKKAKQVVYIGLFSMLLVLMLSAFSVLMPTSQWSHVTQNEFAKIFSFSIRMQIASIVAFFVSQLHDVWAFNFWRGKTKGKFLWLRNNLSTIASQFIDSAIYVFIAFYHLPNFVADNILLIQNTPEKFNLEFVFTLLFSWWLIKVIIAVLDTPLVYLGVLWLKEKKWKH